MREFSLDRFFRNHWSQSAIMFAWCCAVTSSLTGCRSRAQRDVYHAKMAQEIRILEDQLYDADYQNRVLREKLHRARTQRMHAPPEIRARSEPTPIGPAPAKEVVDMGIGLDEPIIDSGEEAVAPPETIPPPDGEPRKVDEGEVMPEPPGGPEPPGPSDVDLPPIQPGEILPPASSGEDDSPPGKIEVPDVGTLPEPTPIPEELKLHSGLSGNHTFDDGDTEGLLLVVNVIDDQGRVMNLERLQINATMTIVALDPTLETPEARIARWEYKPEQIEQFVRSRPVAGLHVPVKWQGVRPGGDEVIVHVRLQTEDEEMRCQGRLSVTEPAAIADWTPRSEKQKR